MSKRLRIVQKVASFAIGRDQSRRSPGRIRRRRFLREHRDPPANGGACTRGGAPPRVPRRTLVWRRRWEPPKDAFRTPSSKSSSCTTSRRRYARAAYGVTRSITPCSLQQFPAHHESPEHPSSTCTRTTE